MSSLTLVITNRLIIGALLFAVATTCAFSSTFVLLAMIGEVNRKLPDSEQIGYAGPYFGKYKLIRHSYRRFYPNGHLEHIYWALGVSTFVFGFAAAVLFGIIDLPF
ncbi:MAG: hypothetical protein JOZ72_03545 [Alphaproteobacteria bacterium]|nr:hypothetical protein [Alphaproteobacteria bacterium]